MNVPAFSKKEGSTLDKLLQQLRIRRIKKYIPKNAIVCDFGCGYEGVMLNSIKDIIGSGVGLDLKINPNYSNDKIQLIEADLNKQLTLNDNYFDVVISLANLEHLENPNHTMKEIYRILKPGGILLMTTPSVYGKPILEFLAYKLHVINEQSIRDHKRYFDKKSLTELCKITGFSLVKHRYFQLFMNNFVYAKK